MSDDYEFDDYACPKCGHEPTHVRRCTNYACDDGWIDMHEFDDPMLFDEGDVERCDECGGTGSIRWCPNCGYDIGRDPERLIDPGDWNDDDWEDDPDVA